MAGEYAQEINRRIGVDRWRIAPDLNTLSDDVRYWARHDTYPQTRSPCGFITGSS
jgi:glutamate dehydrogenase/leucine dehydrogenase